jgi:hypothetical protein
VSAEGRVIAPLVIFKGKQHQESWYNDIKEDEVFFAVSSTGWTSSDIALSWVKEVFDPQTKALANGGYRMLIIDGHSSHIEYKFLKFCLDNKVVPFCMPSHSTHHLQPLDVGVYGPYAIYYGQEVDSETRLSSGILNINKGNFWRILKRARAKTFTSSTIKSAWAKAGLVPFNPRIVYSLLPKEHTPEPLESLRSSSFSPTTPKDQKSARKLIKRVIQDSQGTPQKKRVKKLSSTVETIFTTNILLTQELQDAQRALRNKPQVNKKRLAPIGVFAGDHLSKMREGRDKATLNKYKGPNRQRRSLPRRDSSSIEEREVIVENTDDTEDEVVVEDAIVVG